MNSKGQIFFSAGMILLIVLVFMAFDYFTNWTGITTGAINKITNNLTFSLTQEAGNFSFSTSPEDAKFNVNCVHGGTGDNACED